MSLLTLSLCPPATAVSFSAAKFPAQLFHPLFLILIFFSIPTQMEVKTLSDPSLQNNNKKKKKSHPIETMSPLSDMLNVAQNLTEREEA